MLDGALTLRQRSRMTIIFTAVIVLLFCVAAVIVGMRLLQAEQPPSDRDEL
jgi:fluoride ion exporter CrcB/FEX